MQDDFVILPKGYQLMDVALRLDLSKELYDYANCLHTLDQGEMIPPLWYARLHDKGYIATRVFDETEELLIEEGLGHLLSYGVEENG